VEGTWVVSEDLVQDINKIESRREMVKHDFISGFSIGLRFKHIV
jgi:hypothetical protein